MVSVTKYRIGDRSGRLVITGAVSVEGEGRFLFCTCDCGGTARIRSNNFKRQISCGCLGKRELATPQARLNVLWCTYTRNAAARNRAFSLTRDEFKALVLADCYYCGAPPSTLLRTKRDRRLGREGFAYNGIDRETQSEGYVLSNCRTCCARCNYAKGKMTAGEYFDHCARVAKHALTAQRSVFD